MTDRASLLHYWRVVMAQQAAFWLRDNGTRNYAFSLLEYAGNARREMMVRETPIQADLFAADSAATMRGDDSE